MARGGQNHGDGQSDPIDRHQAGEAAAQIMGQCLGPADIAMVYEQDDETADDEEEIHTGVPELKNPGQGLSVLTFIEMPGHVVKHHQH